MAEQEYTPTEAETEAAARSNYYFQNGGVAVTPSWESRADELTSVYRDEARASLVAAAKVRADERAKRPDREQIALGVAERLDAEARPWGESPRGEDWLDLALSSQVREMIEAVYADCGDSDPGVLSSNIGRMLTPRLLDALDAVLSSLALEPEAREEFQWTYDVKGTITRIVLDHADAGQEEAEWIADEVMRVFQAPKEVPVEPSPEAREVTDERVEEVARGIHALRETPLTWEQEDEPTREYDRKRARAALEAAAAVTGG